MRRSRKHRTSGAKWIVGVMIGWLIVAGMARAEDILILTDLSFCPMADSLQRLYGERARTINIMETECPREVPAGTRFLVSALTRPEGLARLDKGLLEQAGWAGVTIITGLDEYARARGGKVTAEKAGAVYRDLDPASFRTALNTRAQGKKEMRLVGEDRIVNKPALKFVKLAPCTKGFHLGDELPWYGLFDPAVKYANKGKKDCYLEDPDYKKWQWLRLDVSLEDQLWKEWEEKTPRFFWQKRLAEMPKDFKGEVLGVSTIDQKPVLLQEPYEKGTWLAVDLTGPEEPMFHYFLGEGGFNKYVFMGNLINQTVRFGEFSTRWLLPEEMNQRMRDFAAAHKDWTVLKEVEYDYDPAAVERSREALGLPEGLLKSHYENYSLNLGDRKKPIWLIVGGTHGSEAISTLGIMSLAQSIVDNWDKDERMRRFIENYCLKLYPVNNPLDDVSLIYRDPWAEEGFKMKNVNPEADDYFIFMGHDIHGNPGTFASIQQGNGRWVEEAARQSELEFPGRYLEAEPWNNYGRFSGYGNHCGALRPRIRRCIYPNMTSRVYGMNTEMPDARMGIMGGDSVILTYGGKSYSMWRGKIWPMQSYYTLQVTDVIASYLYHEMMPHPWEAVTLASPDPAWEARLWRYNPQQQSGVMAATFRRLGHGRPSIDKSQNLGQDAQATRLTDWEYLDLVKVGNLTPEVRKNELDGRLHVAGLMYSYPLKEGGLRPNRDWREEDTAGPTFLRWHWLQDPDTFRPLVKSHWVLTDADGDGKADTYLVDKENDGLYEQRRSSITALTKAKVGVLGKERGWGDLGEEGLSSLGTWLQGQGAEVVSLGAADDLSQAQVLLVNGPRDNEITAELAAKLKRYVEGGGKLIVTAGNWGDIFPAPGEGKVEYWMARNNENDWEAEALKRDWDPGPLYQKRLAGLNRLAESLGVAIEPRLASNYARIHGGWCWFDQFFGDKPGFADQSGLELAGPHDRLMVESFVLHTKNPALRPVLSLAGDTVLLAGKLGQGTVLLCGTSDIFSNRAISKKLHEPVDWNQPELPAPARNMLARERLLTGLLKGTLHRGSEQAEPARPAGMTLGVVKGGVEARWAGADGRERVFRLNNVPGAGGPAFMADITLQVGDGPEAVLTPVNQTLNRARVDIEIRRGPAPQIILRARQMVSLGSDVLCRYAFSFTPGSDEVRAEILIQPETLFQPVGWNGLAFRPTGGWKLEKTDAGQRLIRDGADFSFAGVSGNVISARLADKTPVTQQAIIRLK